jgi:hypothetical protein
MSGSSCSRTRTFPASSSDGESRLATEGRTNESLFEGALGMVWWIPAFAKYRMGPDLERSTRANPHFLSSIRAPAFSVSAPFYQSTRINESQTVLEQIAWSFVLALPIVCLLLSIRFTVGKSLLDRVGLVFALIIFPLAALRSPGSFFRALRVEGLRPWMFVEVALILAYVLLSFSRKWHVWSRIGLILLAFHFILWSWATGSYINAFSHPVGYSFWSLNYWISSIFHFGFPILGFTCSLNLAYLQDSPNAPQQSIEAKVDKAANV